MIFNNILWYSILPICLIVMAVIITSVKASFFLTIDERITAWKNLFKSSPCNSKLRYFSSISFEVDIESQNIRLHHKNEIHQGELGLCHCWPDTITWLSAADQASSQGARIIDTTRICHLGGDVFHGTTFPRGRRWLLELEGLRNKQQVKLQAQVAVHTAITADLKNPDHQVLLEQLFAQNAQKNIRRNIRETVSKVLDDKIGGKTYKDIAGESFQLLKQVQTTGIDLGPLSNILNVSFTALLIEPSFDDEQHLSLDITKDLEQTKQDKNGLQKSVDDEQKVANTELYQIRRDFETQLESLTTISNNLRFKILRVDLCASNQAETIKNLVENLFSPESIDLLGSVDSIAGTIGKLEGLIAKSKNRNFRKQDQSSS